MWGGAPSAEPGCPRVGDKPSPYCSDASCTPAAHVCTRVPALGGRRGESPKKQQRERGGPAGGACPAGGELGGWEGLKNHKNK